MAFDEFLSLVARTKPEHKVGQNFSAEDFTACLLLLLLWEGLLKLALQGRTIVGVFLAHPNHSEMWRRSEVPAVLLGIP